jgi:hypothetical protein
MHQPSLMRRVAWYWLLCCLGWLSVAWAQAPTELPTENTLPWQVPQADHRLLVLPEMDTAHSLLVPVPPAWGQAKGIAALGADGTPLPALPLIANGTLYAVELHFPAERLVSLKQIKWKSKGKARTVNRPLPQWQTGAQIYLLPAASNGPIPATRSPVLISARNARMLARPATAPEYLVFAGKNLALVEQGELTEFPKTVAEIGTLGGERDKIRYLCSTTLLVADEAPLRLALRSPRGGAWFIFLDQRPIADWVAAGPARDGLMILPPLILPPGPHSLQLAGILADGETLPALGQLTADNKFQAIPASQVFTSRAAQSMAAEDRQAVLTPGLQAKVYATYAFTDGPLLAQVQFRDGSRNLFGRELVSRELSQGSSPAMPVEAEFTAWLAGPGNCTMRYRIHDEHGYTAELVWPFAVERCEARTVQVLLEPGALPLMTPAEGPLVLPYRLTLPDILESRILAQGSLRTIWYDIAGHELRRTSRPLLASPFARTVELADWPKELFRVSLVPTLGEQPLCRPLDIYLLAPEAPPEWRGAAQRLRYRDGFAILRRPALERPASLVAQAPLGKIILVDDLIAAMPHFERDLAPAAYFSTLDLPPLMHRPLRDRSLAGEAPMLRNGPKSWTCAIPKPSGAGYCKPHWQPARSQSWSTCPIRFNGRRPPRAIMPSWLRSWASVTAYRWWTITAALCAGQAPPTVTCWAIPSPRFTRPPPMPVAANGTSTSWPSACVASCLPGNSDHGASWHLSWPPRFRPGGLCHFGLADGPAGARPPGSGGGWHQSGTRKAAADSQ